MHTICDHIKETEVFNENLKQGVINCYLFYQMNIYIRQKQDTFYQRHLLFFSRTIRIYMTQ